MGGVVRAIGGFVGNILGIRQPEAPAAPQAPAPMAAPAEAPKASMEASGAGTTGELKKKAKGKSALTIQSNSPSGGSGLNV